MYRCIDEEKKTYTIQGGGGVKRLYSRQDNVLFSSFLHRFFVQVNSLLFMKVIVYGMYCASGLNYLKNRFLNF